MNSKEFIKEINEIKKRLELDNDTIAESIEMSEETFLNLSASIERNKGFDKYWRDVANSGILIEVKKEIQSLKENQAKVIYKSGREEIINIFKTKSK